MCLDRRWPSDFEIDAYLRQSQTAMFVQDGGSRTKLPLRDGGVLLLTSKLSTSGDHLQFYTDIITLKSMKLSWKKKSGDISVIHALNAFVFEWNIENGQTSLSIPEGVGAGSWKKYEQAANG